MNRPVLCAAILVACCTGCSEATNAIVHTVGDAVASKSTTGDPVLNPAFDFLRVTASGGKVAFLAKDKAAARVETWYSGDREVIRLQDGRLAGTIGTTVEWRNVQLPVFPAWSELVHREQYSWHRLRDVMPGYLYGVEETLVLRPTRGIPPSQIRDVDPARLAWFEETVSEGPASALPATRYAVDLASETVIYGEQCLSREFCFSWQRLAPERTASSGVNDR